MKNWNLAAVSTVVLTSAWSAAPAALVISTDSTAPAGPFVYSQPVTTDDTDSFRTRTSDNTGRDLGQMFTTGTTNLQMGSFTLRMGSNNNIAGQNVTVRFGTITSDGGGNTFTFTPSLTTSANLPGTLTSGDYMTFDVDDTLLAANTKYAFLIGLTTVTRTNRELNFLRRNVSAVAGDDRFFQTFSVSAGDPGTKSNIAFSRGTDRELQFWVNAIPEPGSVALLALGGLIGLRRRR